MVHGPLVRADFASTCARERSTARPVVLIGFGRAGNLGLGYLASTLRARGYQVEILEFEDTFETILAAIRRHDPILVGFSLIFQFYVGRYAEMVRALRSHGVTAHFTMGGHFPTLSYSHTMDLVPELDSVVRFEGELTLLELVDALGVGHDWRAIHGIAYRRGADIVTTDLRPLLSNLDELPYPDRSVEPPMMLGRRVVQMLASRGCIRTCSFCSIHMFYRSAPGKVVRTRKPAEVAREMRRLHDEHGATVFSFQDDDFPVFGRVWQRWAREFVAELYRNDLPGRIIWKINARADSVDSALFAEMCDAGMHLVYMGLESGSDEGLVTLNKSITVEQNLKAVGILKQLGLVFDFGFMLLDPSSTFESILENVAFLRRIVGDGYMAAEFCRMVPYDGTPIKEQLAQQGRLRGDVCNPDYDFRDPRLTDFYVVVSELRPARALATTQIRLDGSLGHRAPLPNGARPAGLPGEVAEPHPGQQRRPVRRCRWSRARLHGQPQNHPLAGGPARAVRPLRGGSANLPQRIHSAEPAGDRARPRQRGAPSCRVEFGTLAGNSDPSIITSFNEVARRLARRHRAETHSEARSPEFPVIAHLGRAGRRPVCPATRVARHSPGVPYDRGRPEAQMPITHCYRLTFRVVRNS